MLKKSIQKNKTKHENSLAIAPYALISLTTVTGTYHTATSSFHIRTKPPISAPIATLKQPIAIPVPKLPKNIGSRNINRMPKGIPHSMSRYI